MPAAGSLGAPRDPDRPLLPPMRQAVGAYDSYHSYEPEPRAGALRVGALRAGSPTGELYEPERYGRERHEKEEFADADVRLPAGRRRHRPPRLLPRPPHEPRRRLLPLRVFLGFISIYAGMGKLCDPVYFDGGERGSMVTWLATRSTPGHSPNRCATSRSAHPVGAGLTVAFLQVVVGVLTVLGLWQRVAAVSARCCPPRSS